MKVKTTFLYQNKFTKTPDETQERDFIILLQAMILGFCVYVELWSKPN